MAEPTEAQRKRSQARERRRSQAAPAENHSADAVTDGAEEPLEAVKHAAKVAAAGAAVGAAAAAARALTSRSDGEEHDSRPAGESEEAQPAEQESPEAESRGNDEPGAEAEETPAAEDESQEPEDRPSRNVPHETREEPVRGASPDEATETVQHARTQLSALLERPVESVSAFERTHDGWLVTLELVEVSRIPESTDVLASYEVELDDDRNLRRYARVRRYIRSQSDREGQR